MKLRLPRGVSPCCPLVLVVLAAVLATALVSAAGPPETAAPAAGGVPFTLVLREYMYWFIAAGSAMVIMILTTSYVTRLNAAMRSEIEIRKEAEVSLRESVTRFEHIVACSGDWIWETDRDGRYTYSSAIVGDMLGYQPDDVLGKHFLDILTAGDRERMKPKTDKVFATKARIFREKYRLVTKDGRVVIHETTAEPVLDGRGELRGYRGVNRDVTSQTRFIRL